MSSWNVKLTFMILLLTLFMFVYYLPVTNGIVIPKDFTKHQAKLKILQRDSEDDPYGIKKICGGFRYKTPLANETISNDDDEPLRFKNGTFITCSWEKEPSSQVNKVIDVELFTYKGLVAILWDIGILMPSTQSEDVQVLLNVPSEMKLPLKFLLRSFADTENGPHCTAYTKEFEVYE